MKKEAKDVSHLGFRNRQSSESINESEMSTFLLVVHPA